MEIKIKQIQMLIFKYSNNNHNNETLMDFQQFYIYYQIWLEVEVLSNQWRRKVVMKIFELINNKLKINKYNQ